MRRALVVGGGIAGTATARELARRDFDVTLVEREDEWRALGHGITMTGPALRALDLMGLLDTALESGYGVTELELVNPAGEMIATLPLPRLLGPTRPGLMGMMRPALHRVLAEAATNEGATAKTGTWPVSIELRSGGVDVEFNDGSAESFDLLVGADGVHSSVREKLHGKHEPTYAGQRVYRAQLPRPEEVVAARQFVGNPRAKAGFTPTGADSMYMFCNVGDPSPEWRGPDEWPDMLREMLEGFGGLVAEVREQITDQSIVDCRLPEYLVVPAPWHKGNSILVGDAAHTTTPHLAAGAAMGLEDAIALGEELDRVDDISLALEAFTGRRADRCRLVVENSATLARWEINPDEPGADYVGLMDSASRMVAEPF